MAAARKDVVEATTRFEQRCVGRNPDLVQVRAMVSLLIALSSTSLAPIESPRCLRFAGTKRHRLLDLERPVLGYVIGKDTGGRGMPRGIFVYPDRAPAPYHALTTLRG